MQAYHRPGPGGLQRPDDHQQDPYLGDAAEDPRALACAADGDSALHGSVYDGDVVEAGTGKPRPVEKVAAVQDQGAAHFAGDRFPRQVAVLRPLGDQHEGVGAFGQLHRILAEGDSGIRIFPAGARESHRIVGPDFGAAFGKLPGDFDGLLTVLVFRLISAAMSPVSFPAAKASRTLYSRAERTSWAVVAAAGESGVRESSKCVLPASTFLKPSPAQTVQRPCKRNRRRPFGARALRSGDPPECSA